MNDAEDIFRLYNNYMFDSYLLKLGSSFVKKYLKIILRSKYCITLVAVDKEVIGFIAATLDSGRLLSGLYRNAEIFMEWIKGFLRHPGMVLKSLELMLYPFNTRVRNVNAEFLFITIEPPYRNKNLGSRLIKEVLALMRQKGIKRAKVSTQVENEPVNTLLKKLGFRIEKRFTLFGKHMYLYSYELY